MQLKCCYFSSSSRDVKSLCLFYNEEKWNLQKCGCKQIIIKTISESRLQTERETQKIGYHVQKQVYSPADRLSGLLKIHFLFTLSQQIGNLGHAYVFLGGD